MKECINKHSIGIAILLPIIGIGLGVVFQSPFDELMHRKCPVIFFATWFIFTAIAGVIALKAKRCRGVVCFAVIVWCAANILTMMAVIPSTVVASPKVLEKLMQQRIEQMTNQPSAGGDGIPPPQP